MGGRRRRRRRREDRARGGIREREKKININNNNKQAAEAAILGVLYNFVFLHSQSFLFLPGRRVENVDEHQNKDVFKVQ